MSSLPANAVEAISEHLNQVAGFVDKGGNTWSLQRYSMMAARTGSQRAYVAGNVAAMQEAGFSFAQVSTHGTLCPICREWEGTVGTIGVEKAGYPDLTNRVPFHPNCLHHLGAWMPGLNDGKAASAEIWDASPAELRQRMLATDEGKTLMAFAGRGYTTENEVKKFIKGGVSPQEAPPGPRYKLPGIEKRRLAATQELLKTGNMRTYMQAMSSQTGQMMRAQGKGIFAKTTKDVAPLPEPDHGPMGTPVSAALQIPGIDSKNGTAIQHAVDLIDQVHGDGTLPITKVALGDLSSMSAYGLYNPNGPKIVINSQPGEPHQHPVMTTLHEVGHLLDHHGLPGHGFSTDDQSPAVAGWWNAVYNSQKYQEILASHNSYLLRRTEVFARSYAQFIATKTGDTEALSQLSIIRGYAPLRVWDSADFQPIAQALEELCKQMNWLK